MKTNLKISTIFAAALIALAPCLGTSAAYAAPNVTPSDVVVPGGTNSREIIITLDRANEGIDGASIRLAGATWKNVPNPPFITVSTNPNTFTDCGSTGVSVKTAAPTTNYTCSLLGTDAIIKGSNNSTALGATTTFRIAPGALNFASTAPSGGYAITAIVSGFNGVAVYSTTIALTLETVTPTPSPAPAPAPAPNPASGSSSAGSLAKTGLEQGFVAPVVAALLLASGGAAMLVRRRHA